jgi:hypothetical protein
MPNVAQRCFWPAAAVAVGLRWIVADIFASRTTPLRHFRRDSSVK